jgi:hypothetical protein
MKTFEMWLLTYRNDFIARIPVYLQLADRVTFKVLPLRSYVVIKTMVPATAGNIFETYFVE